MQVILLEKVQNVGDLGQVVKVKPGFARNFLIPQGKAKRATPENLKLLEERRAELEKAAADKVKRVIKAPAGELSPQLIASFMEMKTVWHPIGV